MRSGFIGWHVMQVSMYYWKAFGSGGLVFHENICCGRIRLVRCACFTGCAEAAII